MTEEQRIPEEYVKEALNWLDSWMGKWWKDFTFTVIEAKQMVCLGAKCKSCPKEVEVRLWYEHHEWPQMLIKDFIGETVLHAKIHAPNNTIIIPGAGKAKYWRGKK